MGQVYVDLGHVVEVVVAVADLTADEAGDSPLDDHALHQVMMSIQLLSPMEMPLNSRKERIVCMHRALKSNLKIYFILLLGGKHLL